MPPNTCHKPQEVEPEFPVHVAFGIYGTSNWDLVGLTVLEVFNMFAQTWNIPNDSAGYIGNKPVHGDYVLKSGDHLEFHRLLKQKQL